MKTQEQFTPSSFDIRQLSLSRFIEYIKARQWVEKSTHFKNLVHVFDRPEPDNRLYQLRIPINETVGDYEDVLARSLEIIAKFESRDAWGVYYDILYFTDDLVSISEITSDSADGTITLGRADSMLSGLKKSFTSAAHLEMEPIPFYPQLDRTDAKALLNKYRFCQTKRGSFVMSVTCPLSSVPDRPYEKQQQNLFMQPFSRRVLTRLMSSVRLIVQAAEADDMTQLVQIENKDTMLCSNLCDALIDLAPTTDRGKVDFGFRWAKRIPYDRETERASVVTLKGDMVSFIESASNQLRSLAYKDIKQSFIGKLDNMHGRLNANNEMAGPVYTKMLDEDNEPVRVRIDFDAQQYAKAMEAHGHGKRVIIRGILRRVIGGGLRIEEHDGVQIFSS